MLSAHLYAANAALIARREGKRTGTFAPLAACLADLPKARATSVVASADIDDSHSTPAKLKLYPSIAMGLLREEKSAVGRVWLLSQHLDTDRRGWITVQALRNALATKGSPLRICGWRRLRVLLHEGAGVFWTRDDNGRLWLNSTKRVAVSLGIERLNGNPIAVDINKLCQPIQVVRAELLATFHASRDSAPISRESLTHVSGLSHRTQQTYDRLSGTRRRTCIAIGQKATKADLREALWQSGGATFKLTDHNGRFGKKGQQYIAKQLPNQYEVTRDRLPKGRQRKINSWLKQVATATPTKTIDLVTTRARGNDGERISSLGRRYCENGKTAVTQQEKQTAPCYWPAPSKQDTKVWFTVNK